MLTTVQDLGRWGLQGRGVPVAGPMDMYSHLLANRLAGNGEAAAALEVTVIGPELQADHDVVCVVTGAAFELAVNGRAVPMHVPFAIPPGGRLRFGACLSGTRASLAIRGGIDVPPVFGSRATSLPARLGPFGGRALAQGDVLPVGGQTGLAAPSTAAPVLDLPRGGARLRAIEGPHLDMFTREAVDVFFSSRFTVTPQSNRMGYRLEGPALTHARGADILSDATPIGSIQVPGSGLPILLMADRQTTGGYPKIATVITADLPVAGQLAPGDWIEFAPCTRDAAIEAFRERFRTAEGR
jgi:antagonist of KipI